ncbi:hypothetical protein C8R44DRAFT_766601 [Mycena epipterygia]|nr:hypothetical protein C8R44DRAFT_766601 [Mycena epipterygia]
MMDEDPRSFIPPASFTDYISGAEGAPDTDAFQRRVSLIFTTIHKTMGISHRRNVFGPNFLTISMVKDIVEHEKLWIFEDGDEDYLSLDRDSQMLPLKHGQMLPTPSSALLQRASQTTPELRIATIIWLVMLSSVVRSVQKSSDWGVWDVQGRAITIWADTFCEVLRSKKRPSDAIVTDDVALADFQRVMEQDGHQHDYQLMPDIGAWVTMRAALFHELKGCYHFNDEDGCSLCGTRLYQKLQSEAAVDDHIPPLHLLALWDTMYRTSNLLNFNWRGFSDFQETIAFAVVRRPELFLSKNVEPVQEFLAQHWPEKPRRILGLHYQLYKNPEIWSDKDDYPSWKRVEDTINSKLGALVPTFGLVGGGADTLGPIEPTLWFDMLQILRQEYQDRNGKNNQSWRPGANLVLQAILTCEIPLPPLNLHVFPWRVNHAVEHFCEATKRRDLEHGQNDKIEDRYVKRYAAAYVILHSGEWDEMDIPLFSHWDCRACANLRTLSKCVGAISTGRLFLKSDNITEILDSIKRLAVSNGGDWEWDSDPEENKEDNSDSSEDSEWRGYHQEIFSDDSESATHDEVMLGDKNLGEESANAKVSGPIWEGDSAATQVHDNLPTGGEDWNNTAELGADTTNTKRGGEVINAQRGPPVEGDSFRAVIPDSLPADLVGSDLAPGTSWSTETFFVIEQPSESGPSRPKNIISTKKNESAKAQRKELRDFFVTLFEKHNINLHTTNMGTPQLPWKNMNQVLAQHGLEIAGWPMGVPAPGSYGKVDKGILGFHAEHIGELYEAMKAGQINFRPLAGGSQISTVHRVRPREHNTEDDDEEAIRASKKGKATETRKKPKAFLDMQSVMKFSK